MNLSAEEKEQLIAIASHAIISYLDKKNLYSDGFSNENFMQPSRTFVTLKKNGTLAGCIGNLSLDMNLADAVRDNAIKAAFFDSRFHPLKRNELDDIEIEISILTEPEKIEFNSAEDLLGKFDESNGLVIKKGWRTATFLPQVWEHFKTKEEFLSHLCMKAGLAKDAWMRDADIYKYRAEKFSGRLAL